MKYARTILDLIGNTPLVKLNSVTDGIEATILVKLEYLNPGGSIKDRIALKMVENAEADGKLLPERSSSGPSCVASANSVTAVYAAGVPRLGSWGVSQDSGSSSAATGHRVCTVRPAGPMRLRTASRARPVALR